MKRITNWIRSTVMSATSIASNWVGDNIVTSAPDIRWQDHLRWWIESRVLGPLFILAYDGSDEELASVYNGEIPPKHMSKRQRIELSKYRRDTLNASCCVCFWHGLLSEAATDECPGCGHAVWIEPFEVVTT